ncbi:ParA family protein [Thiomicrorhabdus indica]|uniref:ParA family protein n=1 Tax=Thiomicrorhabdus indica TaxID=2267253 RepID=UPI00102DC6EA|nr:ParA family protein [Thiomicrorhabdus indica]
MKKTPKIISVASTKGGVGKTTTSANLGAFLSDQDLKVLLIDADVQPSLSEYYVIDEIADFGLTNLITNPQVQPELVASKIEENLHIVMSDDPEGDLQNWVRNTADGRTRLKMILKKRFCEYDVIIIDTQGAVGALQEATIIAADMIISPVIPDKLCAGEFIHNTLGMINRLAESAEFMGFEIAPLKAFLNCTANTNDSQAYAADIRSLEYQAICRVPVTILNSEIPDTVAFRDATSSQMPAHRYEKTSTRKTGSAFGLMSALVKELDVINEVQ